MKSILQILFFFISMCFFGQNKEENKNIDSQNSKNQIPTIDKIVIENLEDDKNSDNEAIPMNKENGFYEVVNYNKEDRYSLRNMKLADKPSVSINEIKNIKFDKDEWKRNIVNIELTKNGAEQFKKLSEENIGKPIAIVLNKKLISAPIIQSVIPNGKIQISGKISNEELKGLKKSLKK